MALSVVKDENNCVLCGSDLADEDNLIRGIWTGYACSYFERGISKKYCLCGECYRNKTEILNYSGEETKRNAAIKYLEEKTADKSSVVREVVDGWINGEEKNYYSNIKDLVYWVEGPMAQLFVFKDRVAVLSSFDHRYACYITPDFRRDFLVLYKCNVQGKEVNNFCLSGYVIKDQNLSDSDILNGKVDEKKLKENNLACECNVKFDIALGDYGTLDFGVFECSFRFFYHQNQLMEEVYNYIQKRMADPDAEDDETEPTIGNVRTSVAKQAEKKEEEKKEGTGVFSAADEIKKMKELFDCGILTQEEFDEAKKRLISKL